MRYMLQLHAHTHTHGKQTQQTNMHSACVLTFATKHKRVCTLPPSRNDSLCTFTTLSKSGCAAFHRPFVCVCTFVRALVREANRTVADRRSDNHFAGSTLSVIRPGTNVVKTAAVVCERGNMEFRRDETRHLVVVHMGQDIELSIYNHVASSDCQFWCVVIVNWWTSRCASFFFRNARAIRFSMFGTEENPSFRTVLIYCRWRNSSKLSQTQLEWIPKVVLCVCVYMRRCVIVCGRNRLWLYKNRFCWCLR